MGLGDKPMEHLLVVARSWLQAPEVKIVGGAFGSARYSRSERAYIFERTRILSDFPLLSRKDEWLGFEIAASEESPLLNACFVIEHWRGVGARLLMNNKEVKRGKDFRYSLRHRLEGTDLIVWVRAESSKPVTVTIKPAEN
jgi:hypothetical protein